MQGDDTEIVQSETIAERQRRLAVESRLIAEAQASLAAGNFVDGDQVLAWLDSIGTDHELPVPYPGR